MFGDNKLLGQFDLVGIPLAPRGVPQVEVTFDIDANGILNVAARDRATGSEQKVTITASTNLSKGEVEKMVDEAKHHESEDRKRRELADARNQGDTLAYQAEKSLRELGEKVPASDREKIETSIKSLREALQGDDVQNIRRLTEEVQQASYALGQQMYAQSQQPAPEGERPPEGESGSGDVVEGEFRET
jgi:molecular chaperone DnaK